MKNKTYLLRLRLFMMKPKGGNYEIFVKMGGIIDFG